MDAKRLAIKRMQRTSVPASKLACPSAADPQHVVRRMENHGYRLHCYVLMTNHYHLLIETPEGNLSQVMHYINGSYTNYINKKRNRSGHLLQGRYKAILVEHDRYLLELSRYLHLNPVRAKMVSHPAEYRQSSYNCYVSRRVEDIVYRDLIMEMAGNEEQDGAKRYREFVETMIGCDIENPLKNIYGGMILGSTRFIKEALAKLKDGLLRLDEISYKKELKRTIGADEVIEAATRYFGMSREELVAGRKGKRNITIYLMKKHTGMTNREVGQTFWGMSCAAVGKMYQRFRARLMDDAALQKEVDRIEKNLSYVRG